MNTNTAPRDYIKETYIDGNIPVLNGLIDDLWPHQVEILSTAYNTARSQGLADLTASAIAIEQLVKYERAKWPQFFDKTYIAAELESALYAINESLEAEAYLMQEAA